jgi:hypothetical protein
MSEINLTQEEADALIKMEKHKVDNQKWLFPSDGIVAIPLASANKREDFILDIRRARIDLLKGTYQNRARQIVTLIRLDFGAKPHRNPDGNVVASPHIHVYREGFGHKWAEPINKSHFSKMDDIWQMLQDFMKFCNITKPPIIERGLFV